MTNEIVKVNYENDRPTIMGRDLHEKLEIKTAYKDWFPRMCEYGFTENVDYTAIAQKRATAQGNETTYIDHQLTIPMAKELCMLQRSAKGKEFRQYFISIEEQWNTPECVMARAIKMADKKIIALETKVNELITKNELLVADTLTWADRPLLNSLVRRYAGFACNGEFALAWTEFKKELLYRYSININSRITAYLNKTGKKTKPKTLEMLSDDELVDALKTIVSMCENKKVDISDLLTKKKSENVA